MLHRLRNVAFIASLGILLPALSPAHAQELVKKWGAHIEAEGKLSSKRDIGELNLFLPIWQDENTLVFGDVRGKLDNRSSTEGNFGIGVRQQINSDWAVGGYGFVDVRNSTYGNTFHQATIGAEALTEDMEFRVNGYIPEAGKQIATSVNNGDYQAGFSGSNLQISHTKTETYERALPGVDIEAGLKFDLPDNWDAWAYAGAYHFERSGLDHVSGPRGRFEVSYNNVPYLGEGSKFTVGLESQRDSVRGT